MTVTVRLWIWREAVRLPPALVSKNWIWSPAEKSRLSPVTDWSGWVWVSPLGPLAPLPK